MVLDIVALLTGIYRDSEPTSCSILAMLLRTQYFLIPSMILAAQPGSVKLAVPMPTAEAPAMINSTASEAVLIPPIPRINTPMNSTTNEGRFCRASDRKSARSGSEEKL